MNTAQRKGTGRRRALATASAALAALGAVVLAGPGVSNASSHREAPLIAGEPQVDNTDVYAFVSPDKPDTVTLIANWIPFEEPNGGPNFYFFSPTAQYDINVDNNGDAQPDVTYRWTFTNHYRTQNTFLYNTGVVTSLNDPDLNFSQTYNLDRIDYRSRGRGGDTTRLASNLPVAPSNVGQASMPNYATDLRQPAVRSIEGGSSKTFAGQSDEGFFLDLRVFDLLYGASMSNGEFAESGHDTLAGYNVNTIALQVPKAELALGGDASRNPVIGVYSTTQKPKISILSNTNRDEAQRDVGPPVQVSRLANPLVNEVVIPLKDKDNFNHSTPSEDRQFLPYVQKPEVPRLIESIYGIPAPATPRNDLVEVFLTGICKACGPIHADLNSQLLNKDVNPRQFQPAEEMRLNMTVPPSSSPNRLGVLGGDLAGFPNGRRVTDDVVDIELQALEGALPPYNRSLSTLGDGVDGNDVPFLNTFPYLATPHNKAVNQS